MKALLILALLVPFGASAQGFGSLDAGDTCYSWEGGHKSAGSFSKCQPNIRVVVQAPPAPVAVAPQIAPSPIMMPMTCAPEPKATRHIVRKRKPVAKC